MAKQSKQKSGAEKLLAKGKEQKHLTQEDVLKALPEMEWDAEQADALYDLLVREEVNGMDADGSSEDEDNLSNEGSPELKERPGKSEAEKEDTDPSAEPVLDLSNP